MQNAQSLISESITRIVYTVCVYLFLMLLLLSSSLLLLFVVQAQFIQILQTSIHRHSFKPMVVLQPWSCPWRIWVYKADSFISEINTRISLGKYCAQIFDFCHDATNFKVTHTNIFICCDCDGPNWSYSENRAVNRCSRFSVHLRGRCGRDLWIIFKLLWIFDKAFINKYVNRKVHWFALCLVWLLFVTSQCYP